MGADFTELLYFFNNHKDTMTRGKKRFIKKVFLPGLISLVLVFLIPSCKDNASAPDTGIITVWHHTGRPAEQLVFQAQVDRFNQTQKQFKIVPTFIPEGDYNTQIQAAAAAGKLPDILDLDGPFLANYAWKGHLQAMDHLLDPAVKKDLLPSILAQGTYHGHLYAVGTFDSGLGLYANKKILAAAGITLPKNLSPPWPVTTFENHLHTLRKYDEDGQVLDLRLDYRGEWYTYAFSPVLQSAGADLIDRHTFQTAAGILNGTQAVAVLQKMQKWLRKGYVDPNTDSSSFVNEKVAFSWCGHWEFPRYRESLADNLILLPLPDFGNGSKTGMGSWCWAITSNCKSPEMAMLFIHFLLRKEEILAMCEANGAVPATRSAIAASPLYQKNGPLHPFVAGLQSAVPRPRTPAYPVITSAFQEAFQDIRHGVDVQQALDNAVSIIDQDIRDNMGYPYFHK